MEHDRESMKSQIHLLWRENEEGERKRRKILNETKKRWYERKKREM